MTATEALQLLQQFRRGKVALAEALRKFQAAPVVDLGYAQVDTHRALRNGFPEVIYGSGKTSIQIINIAKTILAREGRILITRVDKFQAAAIQRQLKTARYHKTARCITIENKRTRKRAGYVTILCAGTSDLPVAEEAAVTAEAMGNRVERIYDVGVAGLHRLIARLKLIQMSNVIVVVAGMEGALPSVVAGLVSKPIIAVPTSVGYGTSFGGLTALLAMLNSCGSGVTVVNIDNGFGAGYAASQINALVNSAAP